jgi:hypothetical protein
MMSANSSSKVGAEMSGVLQGPAAGFGLAAAITILFNTGLAWVKDAYGPLNAFMASLTGHHWRTHGIADVVVFVALGYFFTGRGFRISGASLAVLLAAASVVAGGGVALWFVLT